MFNLGAGEVMMIAVIALIVLGPTRLPEAARTVGKVMGEIRRISSGFQNEVRGAFDADPDATARRSEPTPLQKAVKDLDDVLPPATSAATGGLTPEIADALDEIVADGSPAPPTTTTGRSAPSTDRPAVTTSSDTPAAASSSDTPAATTSSDRPAVTSSDTPAGASSSERPVTAAADAPATTGASGEAAAPAATSGDPELP